MARGNPGSASRILLAVILVLGGCAADPGRTEGLDGVRASGELRIIVRPGFLRAPPAGDGQVDELALLRQLAARLGVRPRVVGCPRQDRLIPWLVEGRGDIAVGRFSPSQLLRTGASPTATVDWVEDLLVTRTGRDVGEFGRLAGATVHIQRSALSPSVAAALEEEGLQVVPVPEEVTFEEILRRVQSGRYQLTVADSVLVDAARARGRIEVIGPVAERRQMVWAVREGNPRLQRAVDSFLFAEKVLSRARLTTACRDLSLVRQARVLRLVTRNSPTTCTIKRGGLEGFEYDLALAFSRRIGVRLELSVPPPGVDPVTWLEEGYGDLAALHEPVAREDEGRFLVSLPYRSVDLVSVGASRGVRLETYQDLADMEVVASRPVASIVGLLPLTPEIRTASTAVGADSLSALVAVDRGEAELAVVDSDTARIELEHRPGLLLGPVVLPEVSLVWLLNVSSPHLHEQVNAFLEEAQAGGLIRQLAASELGSWRPYVPPDLPQVPDGALTPYDEVLQWVGRSHGIDWRLLASLMYEESRFDPGAVGPGGSAGLFQLMPSTWSDLGIEDPHHPGEAAEAAGWYLQWLMDRFADLDLPDQVAMAIASYNVGPRHVFDARRLAAEMKLDPDRWLGNVETAMLILDDPEVARGYAAGVCRCRRAVGYTRRILRRYRAYTEQFPPG